MPYSGIIEKSKEYNIDMIIMGSHGASGVREIFMGSIAEKVVRFSDIPVLVIKKDHDEFKVKDFVFASSFKKESTDTYKQAIKIAQLFEAKIHLLMVNTPSNFMTTSNAEKRIFEFVKEIHFKNYTVSIYNDESIEMGILNFSQRY